VGRVIKVVAAVMDYALWLFFKWSLQADGLRHWYWRWQWVCFPTL